MVAKEDMNVAPESDGYRLMKIPARWLMGTVLASVSVMCFAPKEYEMLRMLAFGAQMLFVGIIVGHNAPMWSRPKLARVRDTQG